MKRDSFNVLFFIKKAKLLKNGEASVCMRITVNGARVENNIRKSIEPALWNQAKECAKGKSRKSCDLNAYIEDARIKLHQTFKELEEQGQFITARLLQEKFFGQDQAPEVIRTLIQTIQEHNDQCRELVGKDYALITVRRYESCKRYLAELIKLKYDKEDLPLSEVNGELIRAFEFYQDRKRVPAEYRYPLHEVFEEDYQPRTCQRMDNQRPVHRHQVPREGGHP